MKWPNFVHNIMDTLCPLIPKSVLGPKTYSSSMYVLNCGKMASKYQISIDFFYI